MKKILLFLLLMPIGIAVKAQVTITLPPIADNTIYENPNMNSNARGANMFAGTNGGGSPRRALIKFDLTGIPAGATITQVSLTLNCNFSRSEPDVISLHKLNSNWGEGTSNAGTGSSGDGGGAPATANDATWLQNFFGVSTWIAAGGDYVPTASASLSIDNTGFYTWSNLMMLSDAQSWQASPTSNFGWVLINDKSGIGTARKFGTRENLTVANRPALSVTYITIVPVTLMNFKVKTLPGLVKLQWQTVQEINNASFNILHSRDGLNFTTIGSLAGAQNSSTTRLYEFIQQQPSPGRHFYKLEMIGTGGGSTLSEVINTTIKSSTAFIWVTAQRSSIMVNIRSTNDISKAGYLLMNMQGILLQKGIVRDGNVAVNNLLPGIYILRIQLPNGATELLKFTRY